MAPKLTREPSPTYPSQPQGILYPVASSGHGSIPKSSDQLVTIADRRAAGFSPHSLMAFPCQSQVQVRQTGFSPAEPAGSSQLGSRQMASVPRSINSLPPLNYPKVPPFPSSPKFNCNRFNCNSELRSRDDTVVTIQDRKVRLSDGDSLYAFGRSWLRNGLPQETQPLLGEGVKLLPRPLPVTAETHLPLQDEVDDEDDAEELDAGSVENLSSRELLQRHVNHAKRVRARLRVERQQRLDRYKPRLALLLPPPAE